MKRKSLAFAGPEPDTLRTFRKACVYDSVWSAVSLRHLKAWGYLVPKAWWSGDMVSLDNGEVLTVEPA